MGGDPGREGLARGDCADADFYRGKLQAARYFLAWRCLAATTNWRCWRPATTWGFGALEGMVLILPAPSRPVTSGLFYIRA